jgi:hypothetical protein
MSYYNRKVMNIGNTKPSDLPTLSYNPSKTELRWIRVTSERDGVATNVIIRRAIRLLMNKEKRELRKYRIKKRPVKRREESNESSNR